MRETHTHTQRKNQRQRASVELISRVVLVYLQDGRGGHMTLTTEIVRRMKKSEGR
jgi:hypothetical protein